MICKKCILLEWSKSRREPYLFSYTLYKIKQWKKTCSFFFLSAVLPAKGQSISEWIYEVIVSPKIRTKNCQDFCLHYTWQKSWQFLFIFWEKQWFINQFWNCLTFNHFSKVSIWFRHNWSWNLISQINTLCGAPSISSLLASLSFHVLSSPSKLLWQQSFAEAQCLLPAGRHTAGSLWSVFVKKMSRYLL